MSIGSIFLIREPVLRGLLYAMGTFFMALAGLLLVSHAWLADESRLILLVPFLAGAILVALAAVLRGMALRVSLLLFFAIPAILLLVLRIGCMVGIPVGDLCA
ncbi:hypothetical protein [Pseudorhodoferax sp. Leaf265]|uniref:hypothetical protein n=1 Tax=Pseudorhodoferax sp. Leaf265 TaxID=1736315 RepID=UPI0007002D3A|nr:hypothetical protein [Pseudorhodoferax sp. Leaf265]KQP05930.1 hypothetical protein ASF45_34025 [Pseudorhodoferax sp. Leaf265]